MHSKRLPATGTLSGTRLHHKAFQSNRTVRPSPAQRTGRPIAVQCAAGLVGCKLVGVGSSTPRTVLTNSDLAQYVDTNDEWIVSRTGIQQRHVLGEGETLTQHAAAASQQALEMAGVSAGEIDLILMATSSPDDAFGNACAVRSRCRPGLPEARQCGFLTAAAARQAPAGGRLGVPMAGLGLCSSALCQACQLP